MNVWISSARNFWMVSRHYKIRRQCIQRQLVCYITSSTSDSISDDSNFDCNYWVQYAVLNNIDCNNSENPNFVSIEELQKPFYVFMVQWTHVYIWTFIASNNVHVPGVLWKTTLNMQHLMLHVHILWYITDIFCSAAVKVWDLVTSVVLSSDALSHSRY